MPAARAGHHARDGLSRDLNEPGNLRLDHLPHRVPRQRRDRRQGPRNLVGSQLRPGPAAAARRAQTPRPAAARPPATRVRPTPRRARPTTAHSAIAGCVRSTSSISSADTLKPPVLMMSTLVRPSSRYAPLFDDSHVAGPEPAVAKRRARFLGRRQYSREHRWARAPRARRRAFGRPRRRPRPPAARRRLAAARRRNPGAARRRAGSTAPSRSPSSRSARAACGR